MSPVRADAHRVRPGARVPVPLVPLVLLVLVAVILRAVAAMRTAVIFADGPSFIQLAQQMGDGNWGQALRHDYHLFYPLLMTIGRWNGLDLETAGILWSILGGALAVVGLYLFLWDAFGARIAWIGGLLLAVSPYAVRFSSDVQSDGVYLGFFLLGIAFLWRALERGAAAPALAAGVLAGLAYLTRPEGVGIVVAGVVLAVLRRLSGSWQGSSLARWLAALLLGFALPASPYLVALGVLEGAPSLSGKKSLATLFGLDSVPAVVGGPLAPLFALLALVIVSGTAFVLWRSRARLTRVRRSVVLSTVAIGLAVALATVPLAREFASVVVSSLGPATVLFVGLGLVAGRANPMSDRSIFVGAFLVLYGIVLIGLLANYGYLSRRHALPPLVLLLAYAASGTVFVADWLRTQWSRLSPTRELSVGVSLALALVMVGSTELPKTLRRHRDDALAERRAAEWLRDQAVQPGLLASVKNRTAYYANRGWVPLHDPGDGQNLDVLQFGPARFVILGHDVVPSVPSASGVDLVELHRAEAAGEVALVYQIVRDGS